MVSVDDDCTLIIWCLRTGQPLVSFRGSRANKHISGLRLLPVVSTSSETSRMSFRFLHFTSLALSQLGFYFLFPRRKRGLDFGSFVWLWIALHSIHAYSFGQWRSSFHWQERICGSVLQPSTLSFHYFFHSWFRHEFSPNQQCYCPWC